MSTITFSILLDHIEDNEGERIVLQHYPWEGTDRNYLYEEVSFPSGKKEKKCLCFSSYLIHDYDTFTQI